MPPDPQAIDRLFETFIAYQRTAAMKAAVDLDLFTALGEGDDSVPALARRTGASERGLRMLCDSLAALGFLTKERGRYAVPEDIQPFLDRRSPVYAASAIQFLASPVIRQGFDRLTEAVRRGGTVVSEEGSTEAEHPMWIDFARAMAPIATFSAQLIANLLETDAAPPWKVLDVAAGHGMFGITLAQRNPRARIVALDWKNVLAVAEENARAAGVMDRYELLPGSAFEVETGGGYDLVLLANILHHFDAETCERLLRRMHRALAPGGRAVTIEFVPDEDRTRPAPSATFSLVMLASTPAGDAYTYAELERMFRSAGFRRNELHEIPPSFQRVIVSHA
ncbi:MAG: methyltransferase [Candidatus Binatia bacterium]